MFIIFEKIFQTLNKVNIMCDQFERTCFYWLVSHSWIQQQTPSRTFQKVWNQEVIHSRLRLKELNWNQKAQTRHYSLITSRVEWNHLKSSGTPSFLLPSQSGSTSEAQNQQQPGGADLTSLTGDGLGLFNLFLGKRMEVQCSDDRAPPFSSLSPPPPPPGSGEEQLQGFALIQPHGS